MHYQFFYCFWRNRTSLLVPYNGKVVFWSTCKGGKSCCSFLDIVWFEFQCEKNYDVYGYFKTMRCLNFISSHVDYERAKVVEKISYMASDKNLVSCVTLIFFASLIWHRDLFFISFLIFFLTFMFLIWHRDILFVPFLTLQLVWLVYPTSRYFCPSFLSSDIWWVSCGCI